jgi:transposase
VPARDDRKRAKADALAEDGTLNPAPDKVGDPKFQEGGFFDPRDVVQVKYEMLRRVSVEKMSVTDVSNQYGVSRPTFYQAKADFDEAGIAGLVPQKRGPHGPHKIQSNVRAFLIAQLSPGEPIRARELAKLVQKEFGVDVHPRTIERAVRGKKTRSAKRAGDRLGLSAFLSWRWRWPEHQSANGRIGKRYCGRCRRCAQPAAIRCACARITAAPW